MHSAVTPRELRSWPGEWCKRCDRRNCVGFTVSDGIWEAVVQGRWTVLCTTCFDELAEQADIHYRFTGVTGEVYAVSWSDWLYDGPADPPDPLP